MAEKARSERLTFYALVAAINVVSSTAHGAELNHARVLNKKNASFPMPCHLLSTFEYSCELSQIHLMVKFSGFLLSRPRADAFSNVTEVDRTQPVFTPFDATGQAAQLRHQANAPDHEPSYYDRHEREMTIDVGTLKFNVILKQDDAGKLAPGFL